jgi:HK97 gp10 family phage protein
MEFKINLKISPRLKRLRENVEAAIEAGLLRAAAAVEARAVEEAPKVRGNLANSIRKYIRDRRAVITPVARYALYIHQGTGIYGPHKAKIVPVHKKALAFTIGGKTIIRRSVKGQKANPFMKRAFDEVRPRMKEIFDGAIADFLHRG